MPWDSTMAMVFQALPTASIIRQRPLRPLTNLTRAISRWIIFLLATGWQSLMAEDLRFDLSAAEIVKFAMSFGSLEASNDTLQRILQVGLNGADSAGPRSLIAFEENRSFVFALLDLSETQSARPTSDSPHLTRRLIFLKPSTFVIDDEIEGAVTGKVDWLLHSRSQPSVSGRIASVIEGKHQLTCETLSPEAVIRQVKRQPGNPGSPPKYSLQTTTKQPSKTSRFLHLLHIREQADEHSTPKSTLLSKDGSYYLTVETSQRTYKLSLLPVSTGAGEIEIARSDGKRVLDRRFLPAGVLPHGSEGVRLLDVWDASYRGGKRPFWDAGQASAELRRVVEQGIVRPGSAIDLGCGTGTDAIYLASKGFDVTAIDIAPTALSQAREKAERAGVRVRWLLASVLSPPQLSPFDFIFDRGCYHEVRFDNARAYVETVRQLSLPGRTRFLLLAGNPNEVPGQYAPPQVAEEDIRSDFSALFEFEWLRETRFETSNPSARGPLAWSVMLRRKDVR